MIKGMTSVEDSAFYMRLLKGELPRNLWRTFKLIFTVLADIRLEDRNIP